MRQALQVTLQVIVLLVFAGIMLGSGYVVGFLDGRASVPQPEPQPAKDWRPNLRNCPDDVELWDCIRHAMYNRRDI